MSGRQARPRRSTAEWVTFVVACAVLALVIGAIASLRIGGKPNPPAFSVSSSPARQEGGRFHVRAVVKNTGDETAENVQVVAELQTGSEAPVEAEQVIDFLSGGDEQEVEFVFADDPASGELEIEVLGFTPR